MAAFFVAVGLVLLAILLGMLMAAHPELVVPVGALAAMMFGAAFLLNVRSVRRRVPFVRTKEDRDEILRVQLGALLTEGNELAREASRLTSETHLISDLEHRASRWGGQIKTILDRERPGWTNVFLDDSAPQTVSQYVERDGSGLV
jgi:hypothetical protein